MSRLDEIKQFLSDRTAAARDQFDFVFADILHREFLRWGRSHRKDGTSLDEIVRGVVHRSEPKLGAFVEDLDGMGLHPQELVRSERRDLVYDLALLDQESVEVERRSARERAAPVVIEKLQAKLDLDFTDTTIPAGAIVEHVQAGELEDKRLQHDYEQEVERLKEQARPWIVILWKGKRRLVRSAWFARLQKDEITGSVAPWD